MASLEAALAAADTLTFDCYGTLIDWETGLRDALRTVLGDADGTRAEAAFGEYLAAEAAVEAQAYRPYREVLAEVARRLAQDCGAGGEVVSAEKLASFVKTWRPYPDTCAALTELKSRFRLGVLSNIDRDLFAATAKHFPVDFDFTVIAEDVRAYKPAHLHFTQMLASHAKRGKVVHVAQSLYHDGAPCRQLDIPFVWINRRNEKNNTEASPLAQFPDLKSFAAAVAIETASRE